MKIEMGRVGNISRNMDGNRVLSTEKGSQVYEAPAAVGSGEGKMYTALSTQAERMFPQVLNTILQKSELLLCSILRRPQMVI